MKNRIYYLAILFLFICCSSENQNTPAVVKETIYFPPLSGSDWETKTVASLNWNQTAVHQKHKGFYYSSQW
jgi:hypothetical protein